MSEDAPAVVIRDAVLFTPDGQREGDCVWEGGVITQLGQVRAPDNAHTIDARGRWLWPGAFDAHAHLRDPGHAHKEDLRTGTEAAVAGGVTSVFDMPNTHPATITLEALEHKRAIARERAVANFGLFFGANPHNLDAALQAQNIPALKVFMASSTGDLLVDRDEDLDRIFSQYPGRIAVHAEDEPRLLDRAARYAGREDAQVHSLIRDPEAARLGVERCARLAATYGRRLHVLHVSTQAELDALDAGRALGGGARITAEVCPHHLFLSVEDYETWGHRVKMNPPLRMLEDQAAVWDALRRGALAMVATDHAPHLLDEKARPYAQAPSGVPGVQTMLPLLLDAAHRGLCTPAQVLEWVCHAPARIYEVQGRGQLAVGMSADVVLIDPTMRRVVTDAEQRSRCGWTPYAGRALVGWPVMTWVNGALAFAREDDGPGVIMATRALGQEVIFSP